MEARARRSTDVLRIVGQRRLSGSVAVSGAKNAALPIMAASILASEPIELTRVPQVADVRWLAGLLDQLGIDANFQGAGSLRLATRDAKPVRAPRRFVARMRASVCVLGPLLAKRRRAIVPLPGGCRIGPRPIDLHLRGLAALGAELSYANGRIVARARRLRGATLEMSGPNGSTVTGTANVLCAATLASGQTVLRGAALEPEIVDLGRFLIALGARIEGLGTSTIEIRGVDELGGANHELIPDRIEAGTVLAAVVATGGQATINGVDVSHLEAALAALESCGVAVSRGKNSVSIHSPEELRPIELCASPYPGFPTDLQAQFTALACHARGTSRIGDEVFATRFAHLPELRRLGARVALRKGSALIQGGFPLRGARLQATDLRASAALVVAALSAPGTSIVGGLEHLDRGYENLSGKLAALGAQVARMALAGDRTLGRSSNLAWVSGCGVVAASAP